MPPGIDSFDDGVMSSGFTFTGRPSSSPARRAVSVARTRSAAVPKKSSVQEATRSSVPSIWPTRERSSAPQRWSTEHWERIDVWVNVAMATLFAPVSDTTAEEYRRVTEVTYLGYVHGTLAALKRMRRRNASTTVQGIPPSLRVAAARAAGDSQIARASGRARGGAAAGRSTDHGSSDSGCSRDRSGRLVRPVAH